MWLCFLFKTHVLWSTKSYFVLLLGDLKTEVLVKWVLSKIYTISLHLAKIWHSILENHYSRCLKCQVPRKMDWQRWVALKHGLQGGAQSLVSGFLFMFKNIVYSWKIQSLFHLRKILRHEIGTVTGYILYNGLSFCVG